MAINFYDYVSSYDFVPFAELQSNDDFKVISSKQSSLISTAIKEVYKKKSEVTIEFKPETIKKEKTILKFKLKQAHQYASDPDGYLRYKLTAVNGQVFVSNYNKKEIEHDLGVKRYDGIVEIVFSKNLMQSVKYIDFYYKDNTDAWLDLKGELPDSWEHCGRVTIGAASTCYCNRGFTEEEMTNILTQLRKSDDVHYEIQFDKSGNTLYIDKEGKVISSTDTGRRPPEAVDKYRVQKNAFDKEGINIFDFKMEEKIQSKDANINTLTDELNKAFEKYQINTCIRKIHFLAQSYEESQRFHKTYESNPISTLSGGEHYRGRGLLQLTHDYNYEKFYIDLFKKIPTEKELDNFASRVSKELHLAVFGSAFYWKNIGSLKGNISQFADKDDVLTVSKEINGYKKNNALPNGYEERVRYTNELKKIFKYEKCINKK
ncbi:hypothetical protein JI750_12125 [Flavobacterium sp. GN10]|uniref:Glycoside hydrolase family 19 catalytic domain-containing protein n=1 Tax=Flavobacterium tagetis TaxID=2801336 RepID=A0ABS1KDR5_9FLAO|nr:hypothetical protein [Flavobacterium tagetis]MBL0737643.1 hypothetical protein [Flavobacterium tagetis]